MLIQAKYKEKAVGCMNGLCLHLDMIAPRGKITTEMAKKSSRKARKALAPSSAQQPQHCPATNLFLPLADMTEPKNGQWLNELVEECIRDGQTAIGQLEVLKARENVLKEIQEGFEKDEETTGEEDGEERNEDGAEGERQMNKFVDKFIHQLKAQYELARKLEMMVPSLLEELCSGSLQTEEKLSSERLFTKNFAKLIEIAIRFDSLKSATPELQNGFSLYRRMCVLKQFGSSRPALYAHLGDQIALFLSRPSPLLQSLVNGAERFIGRQLSRQLAISHLTEALLVIYNVLKHTMERRRQFNLQVENGDGNCPVRDFFLRSMVGVLLLFDHIQCSPGGVFCCSHSPFDIAEFAALVKRDASVEQANLHLSTLRFMSRHFNDAETPGHVRKMLS